MQIRQQPVTFSTGAQKVPYRSARCGKRTSAADDTPPANRLAYSSSPPPSTLPVAGYVMHMAASRAPHGRLGRITGAGPENRELSVAWDIDINLCLAIGRAGCKMFTMRVACEPLEGAGDNCGSDSGQRFTGATMANVARAACGLLVCLGLLGCLGLAAASGAALAATKSLSAGQIAACIAKFHIDVNGTENKSWRPPAAGSCKIQVHNRHRYPDPKCTPGSLNPTVKVGVLKSAGFSTQCIRNQATGSSETQKSIVFRWYGVRSDQTCEKDHFVPLEVGGADTLDNIWPQCGPSGATGTARYFRQKDTVEGYLARQVKAGMSQQAAEQGIKSDWTRYVGASGKSKTAKTGTKKAKPAKGKPKQNPKTKSKKKP
jgi:hypothetical protein